MKNIVLIIFISVLCSSKAFAVGRCSNPDASVGTMRYISSSIGYAYCTGADLSWVPMQASSTMGAACTKAGMINGNKFCKGTNYYTIDSATVTTACTTANTFKYISNKMYICVSGSWHETGGCTDCGPGIVTCEDYGMDETSCLANACNWTGITCETYPIYCPTCNGGGGEDI